MKIFCDTKNKAIIATCLYKGKRLRAVTICKKEDVYDEEFGKILVELKLLRKKTLYRLKDKYHFRESCTKEIAFLERERTRSLSESVALTSKYDDIDNSISELLKKLDKPI